MDREAYAQRQKILQEFHESQCKRCGACCGALGEDPCALLRSDEQGKFYCGDYAHRLGLQKTVAGKEFHCVLIRELGHSLPFRDCAYFRHG